MSADASTAPLRIGVDARSLLCAEPRGEGKTLLRLYSEIVAERPGVEVIFFGDAAARRFTGSLPPGTRAVAATLPSERWNGWEDLLLPWLAWRHRCNVLHAASSGAPWWSPVPVLMTVHDLIPLRFEDGHDARAKAAFGRRLRRGAAQARRVIAVSAHTRSDLLATLPALSVPVDVVHWGCDTVPAVAVPPSAIPYLVAFVGEARRKNTAYVVDRFIAVAARSPTVRLVLVGIRAGAGAQRRQLAAAFDAAGLAGRVDMPSFVAEDALDALIRGARAVLYLSLYEGFGLPVLESIARGVPVVASDRTSIPEILDRVPGGFALADTGAIEDAAVALVADDALRADWVARQGSVLPRFDWRDTARRTLQAIDATARTSAAAAATPLHG